MAPLGRPFLPWSEFQEELRAAEDDPVLQRIVGDVHSHVNRGLEVSDVGAPSRWLARQLAKRAVRRRRAPDVQTRRVTFFADGEHPGLSNLLPILEALDRRAAAADLILFDDLLRSQRRRLSSLKHVRLVSVDALSRSVSAAEIARSFREARRHQQDLVSRLRRGQLRQALADHPNYTRICLAQQEVWEAAMARYFERQPCSAFVSLAFTNGLSQAGYVAARQRGIPTVVVVNGVTFTLDASLVPPYVADVYLGWGPHWDSAFEEARRAGARVANVGYGRYDGLRNQPRNAAVPRLVPQLARPQSVLYLTDSSTLRLRGRPATDEFYGRLGRVMRPFVEQGEFVFKLHPGEDLESKIIRLAWPADLFGRCGLVHEEFPLKDLLPYASVVLGGATTGLLEAMILEIPVVQVQSVDLGPFDLETAGCLRARVDEAAPLIHRLRHDAAFRRRTLERQSAFLSRAFANLGHACERAADVLEGLGRSQAASSLEGSQRRKPPVP